MCLEKRLSHSYRLGTLARKEEADCWIHKRLDIFEMRWKVNGKSSLELAATHRMVLRHSAGNHVCCGVQVYHRISADAHVSPAPKAPSITREPLVIRPWRTASSRAMGIDAADVLP